MNHFVRSACFALPLMLVAAAAAPAGAADGDDSVGVVVDGEGTLLPILLTSAENWLRVHGYPLVSSPIDTEGTTTLLDCLVVDTPGCAKAVVQKQSKSYAVVHLRASVKAGSDVLRRTVELRGTWITKGSAAPYSLSKICTSCGNESLRTTAEKLLEALAAAASNRGRIDVKSTPDGATVTAGKQVLGKTPIDYTLPLGNHSVYIQKDGWIPQRHALSVVRGKTAPLSVDLAQPGKPSKLLPLTLIAAGAAAAITGGILFVLDEDQPNDLGQQKPTYRNTGVAGVATGTVGLAIAATGVILLLRLPEREPMPVVSILPSGGAIGWTGRF